MEKLSLNEVFEKARNIAQSTSPKATFLLDYAVSKHIREYLNLCYAYLRWVDDIVDNPEITLSEKKSFINRQISLIESYKNNFKREPVVIEEYFLKYFIRFSIENSLDILIDSVFYMVNTISWDVERLERDGLFTQGQLNNYIDIQSESFYKILYYFSSKNDPSKNSHDNLGISNACTRLYMIRDLEEDIDAGFINISREDIASYNIDLKNLKQDKNLSIWVEDQINNILNSIYNESTRLRLIPLKQKIFFWYLFSYYLNNIIRYRVYGHTLGKNKKRSFLREVKTYLQSILISLRLFGKVFIK